MDFDEAQLMSALSHCCFEKGSYSLAWKTYCEAQGSLVPAALILCLLRAGSTGVHHPAQPSGWFCLGLN